MNTFILVVFGLFVFLNLFIRGANKQKREWLFSGSNKIFCLMYFFHVLTITWRFLLYFFVGHPNKGYTYWDYMTWKASAMGDEPNSLTALAVYLVYTRNRYLEDGREDIDRSAILNVTYFMWAIIGILAYSTVWGYLFFGGDRALD